MHPLEILGSFFAKHTILYVVTLICGISFGGQVAYLNTNFVHAGDFEQYIYEDKRYKLLEKKYVIEDKLFELNRRIEKGIHTQGDIDRLKEKNRELSRLKDELKEHESNRPK